MSIVKKSIVALPIAGLVGMIVPFPAVAGVNWQPTWSPEDLNHFMRPEGSLQGVGWDAYARGVGQADLTNASVNSQSVGDNWIDVTVRVAAISAVASWQCVSNWTSPTGQTRCDLSIIRYGTPSLTSTNTAYWKAIGCHEAAHSLGLGERPAGDNSCTRMPATQDVTSLAGDDISTFNLRYSNS